MSFLHLQRPDTDNQIFKLNIYIKDLEALVDSQQAHIQEMRTQMPPFFRVSDITPEGSHYESNTASASSKPHNLCFIRKLLVYQVAAFHWCRHQNADDYDCPERRAFNNFFVAR